jgi:hypothetical protein
MPSSCREIGGHITCIVTFTMPVSRCFALSRPRQCRDEWEDVHKELGLKDEIREAIAKDDVLTVSGLLRAVTESKRYGDGLNMRLTSFGYTPLHLACKHGCDKIVSMLLDLKADVNCQTQNRDTPLHLAVRSGHNMTRGTRVLLKCMVCICRRACIALCDAELRDYVLLGAVIARAPVFVLLFVHSSLLDRARSAPTSSCARAYMRARMRGAVQLCGRCCRPRPTSRCKRGCAGAPRFTGRA